MKFNLQKTLMNIKNTIKNLNIGFRKNICWSFDEKNSALNCGVIKKKNMNQ